MITTDRILKIIQTVCPNVDTDRIDPDINFREYGIDSMDFFNIILEIQELLGREIPDEHIDRVRTINSIKAYSKSQD